MQAEIALWLHGHELPWDDRAARDAVLSMTESLPEIAAANRLLDEPDLLDDLQRESDLLVSFGLRRRQWDFVTPALGEAFALAALRLRGGGFGNWLEHLRPRQETLPAPALSLLAAHAPTLSRDDVAQGVEHVRRVRPELVPRLLPALPGLAPEHAFELLRASPGWDGDDLLALVRAWEQEGHDLEQARRILASVIDEKLPFEQAAWFHYALAESALGVDDEEFLRSVGVAGRPTLETEAPTRLRVLVVAPPRLKEHAEYARQAIQSLGHVPDGPPPRWDSTTPLARHLESADALVVLVGEAGDPLLAEALNQADARGVPVVPLVGEPYKEGTTQLPLPAVQRRLLGRFDTPSSVVPSVTDGLTRAQLLPVALSRPITSADWSAVSLPTQWTPDRESNPDWWEAYLFARIAGGALPSHGAHRSWLQEHRGARREWCREASRGERTVFDGTPEGARLSPGERAADLGFRVALRRTPSA